MTHKLWYIHTYTILKKQEQTTDTNNGLYALKIITVSKKIQSKKVTYRVSTGTEVKGLVRMPACHIHSACSSSSSASKSSLLLMFTMGECWVPGTIWENQTYLQTSEINQEMRPFSFSVFQIYIFKKLHSI